VGCGGGVLCSPGCSCSVSVEAPSYCRQSAPFCEQLPQMCMSTVQCPLGQHCFDTSATCDSDRCATLC
jgi:hypothetical protein